MADEQRNNKEDKADSGVQRDGVSSNRLGLIMDAPLWSPKLLDDGRATAANGDVHVLPCDYCSVRALYEGTSHFHGFPVARTSA